MTPLGTVNIFSSIVSSKLYLSGDTLCVIPTSEDGPRLLLFYSLGAAATHAVHAYVCGLDYSTCVKPSTLQSLADSGAAFDYNEVLLQVVQGVDWQQSLPPSPLSFELYPPTRELLMLNSDYNVYLLKISPKMEVSVELLWRLQGVNITPSSHLCAFESVVLVAGRSSVSLHAISTGKCINPTAITEADSVVSKCL